MILKHSNAAGIYDAGDILFEDYLDYIEPAGCGMRLIVRKYRTEGKI